MRIKTLQCFVTFFCLTVASLAFADISVPLYFTTDKGKNRSAGTVKISETRYGLLFIPDLHGLKPGIHGFHIHENPSCTDQALAAGGHFDPKNRGKHLGPYNDNGHLGDLPAIYVSSEGTVTLPVLAPRILHLREIKNLSLMVHHGGDNYSDVPAKLGGGEGRMACGVIK